MWHVTSTIHGTRSNLTERKPLYAWGHRLAGALSEMRAKVEDYLGSDHQERGEPATASYTVVTQVRKLAT